MSNSSLEAMHNTFKISYFSSICWTKKHWKVLWLLPFHFGRFSMIFPFHSLFLSFIVLFFINFLIETSYSKLDLLHLFLHSQLFIPLIFEFTAFFQNKETICTIIYFGLWACCLWSWKTKDSAFPGILYLSSGWYNMTGYVCLWFLSF